MKTPKHIPSPLPKLACICHNADDQYRDIVAKPDHYLIASRVDKEHATFIVHACNAHNTLISALAVVRNCARTMNQAEPSAVWKSVEETCRKALDGVKEEP